jgi:hypothetical protein
MQTSNFYACCTGSSCLVAMVALMLGDDLCPPAALVLLIVGAGLVAGVCVFAEWQGAGRPKS